MICLKCNVSERCFFIETKNLKVIIKYLAYLSKGKDAKLKGLSKFLYDSQLQVEWVYLIYL